MRLTMLLALLCASGMSLLARGTGGDEKGPPQKIVVALTATWPPMEFINEDKKMVGFDVDLLEQISAITGLEIELKNAAWDGIFVGLGNGKFDAIASSVTITNERKKAVDFTIPYLQAGQILVVPKTDSSTQLLTDLEGQMVGAQIGTTGSFEVAKFPAIKLRNYDDIGLAVQDLANGNLKGVVMDNTAAANYALVSPHYKNILKMTGKILTSEQFGIVVRKGDQQLLELLNGAIQQLLDNGAVAKLEEKWLK